LRVPYLLHIRMPACQIFSIFLWACSIHSTSAIVQQKSIQLIRYFPLCISIYVRVESIFPLLNLNWSAWAILSFLVSNLLYKYMIHLNHSAQIFCFFFVFRVAAVLYMSGCKLVMPYLCGHHTIKGVILDPFSIV
jgi:hypothetical protein